MVERFEMIKINLEKKLNLIGSDIETFKYEYSEKLLNSKYKVVRKSTINGRETLSDKFNLGINNLGVVQETRMHLDDILLTLYNNNQNLKDFINSIFNSFLTNSVDAKEFLRYVILLDPNELEFYKNQINNYATVPNLILEKIFNYERNNQTIIRPKFETLKFRVCIYCNRNFISNFEVKKNKRASFTLDHYYQQDKFPIFSLSLYNLIPSCATCNTNVKNTRDVEQYKNPYDNDYDFHEKAKFKLMPNYKVKLRTGTLSCGKYIRDFYHNEIYETHTLEVKEFIDKRNIFTDDIIKKIADLLHHSEARVKEFLFGDIINKELNDTDQLGKLKIDMAEELHII